MSLLLLFAMLAAGLVALLVAGDLLVRGALKLALRIGVPPLVAGVVIVGFGTSAPEMLVAVDAALSGAPGLAFGNIVGSNIANLWLVLGLPALFCVIHTTGDGLRRALFAAVLATAAWSYLTYTQELTPIIGMTLLGALGLYLLIIFFSMRDKPVEETEFADELEDTGGGPLVIAAMILGGIIGLPLGAHLTIEGGIGLARHYNVPAEIVGLTVLAVGTSLPEVGAGLAAAFRKNGDVVIGNVVGSNLFNITAAGGIVALFGPFDYPAGFHAYDHWAMGLSLLLVTLYILFRKSIGFITGILFIALYAVYILGLVYGWSIPWVQ